MILGFNKRFQGKILAGVKIHTIRVDEHSRWKKGIKIQFATGVRTKNYKQFAEGVCIKVKEIRIEPGERKVYLEGYNISLLPDVIANLAMSDGFDTVEDFWKWFNKPMVGKLIYFKLI